MLEAALLSRVESNGLTGEGDVTKGTHHVKSRWELSS